MVTLQELTDYTNSLLEIERYKDYCPNGLQVEGRFEIERIISGVTASQALIDIACDKNADAIFVHHGYFWKNEDPRITGIKRNRLRTLLSNQISLFAYHLPLDMHPEVGNNAQLAKLLDIQIDGQFQSLNDSVCGNRGHLRSPLKAKDFRQLIDTKLNRKCTHVDAGPELIKTVGWCTGAGQGFIDIAVKDHLDAYISGEISEPTAHIAREAGIHYFAAGHHATERFGIQALANHLKAKFGLHHEFVDIDNPA